MRLLVQMGLGGCVDTVLALLQALLALVPLLALLALQALPRPAGGACAGV